MKTLLGILLGLVLLSLASCEEPISTPTSEGVKEPNLHELDRFRVVGGTITIYKYGNDTLYFVEGATSSSPVGITVK